MNLELIHFKHIVTILKGNDKETLEMSVASSRTHWMLMLEQYEEELAILKRMITRFKVLAAQVTNHREMTAQKKLHPWIPVLKEQKVAAVYEDVAYDTLKKVTSSKKEVDDHNRQLEEMDIQIKLFAKQTKTTKNTVERAELQLYILENAIAALTYFDAQGVSASSIADYEIEKYYELFRRQV